MADRYANFANSGLGRTVVKRLGLPDPPRLRRHQAGDPLADGPVLVGAAPDGRLSEPIRKLLGDAGVEVAPSFTEGTRYAALIFDATGIVASEQLRALYDYFHAYARSVKVSGRVIVLGTQPDLTPGPEEATAQRSLEGLTRSIGKEFGRGVTSQLVYVAPGGEGGLESTLRFLLSGRSAYVSGQVIRIGAGTVEVPADWERPLAGKLALVTGAARGIGAAIARTLARDGADVIALDVPAAGDSLADVANSCQGRALQLDLTAEDAPARLAGYLAAGPHAGVDIVVHNAGITRDKTIARMSADHWDSVIGVNLTAPSRVNDLLLSRSLIPSGGRIIGVASIAGIAGNRGQTNYATSKAGVIGMVESHAADLLGRGITINAVAPGFIETAMTAKMPVGLREAGRRLNSLSQGGLPIDVAETIAWFASPASAAITGNVVRVCGQSLLGA
ncbi:3-oxoacyl-[acyl-carrier protein] reductase [Actinoplanes lutulentus]|uniref:3-oxoacyl-[acyl-carrier protein] reductase n=1 Tax=Actinoplanes lutulentus TaxID=1287878 RepID=A0A327ZJQ0_9ACTN|nr:3-oxoacyl-ACP reductase [Actinoplanes lutulentus]MBB2944296.1 3-oxoacyl-[acyl-carrier protein] reductase [Actinoplanes lutulentus]RAK42471.1 3-oxoacyl-[acyl-carrier protein] reductase [Actinoplanes lutulentus]